MKLSDFKGVFKKSVLRVMDVSNPYGDYYQIRLKPSDNTMWEPGEHGVFTLKDKGVKGKKWHAFSVASIQEEGFLLIATRTGDHISNYKKVLIDCKKDDTISLIGPFGWFKIKDETSPMILIANGIGITPIRALLKNLENDKKRQIEVIYASSDYYLFEDEIEAIAKKNKKIIIHKTKNREQTKKMIETLVDKYNNTAYYYVSGSIKAIKSNKKNLKNGGIKSKHIINDPFFGY